MNIKQTVYKNDQRLIEMTIYHESKGMTRAIKGEEQLSARFTEFKMLIKRGSFTIKELEEKIFSENGIITSPSKRPMSIQEMLFHTAEMSKELQNKKWNNGKKRKK